MPHDTIFLTGATGFIGGATAARLLQDPSSPALLLLARGDTTQDAEDRIRRSLGRYLDPGALDQVGQRCQVIAGDLTDPALLADHRLDEVTRVLHLAANTSFRSVRGVRHTNIVGTLGLAHRMRRVPGLRRFIYVSTAHICGADSSPVVEEHHFPHSDVRHLVEYTASKAECEILLQRTAAELPMVVARPSIVIGHRTLGCGPSGSLFWYYRALHTLRVLPAAPERRKDIVPVDYIADALVFLLRQPRLRHACYHISAGEASSVTWREIDQAFANCYRQSSKPECQVIDRTELADQWPELKLRLGTDGDDRLLTALQTLFPFSQTRLEYFDNRRLLGEGMAPPPRFTSYLPRCVALASEARIHEQMAEDGW